MKEKNLAADVRKGYVYTKTQILDILSIAMTSNASINELYKKGYDNREIILYNNFKHLFNEINEAKNKEKE